MLCLIASLMLLFVIFKGIFERVEGPSLWETVIASSIFNSVASYSGAVFAFVLFQRFIK